MDPQNLRLLTQKLAQALTKVKVDLAQLHWRYSILLTDEVFELPSIYGIGEHDEMQITAGEAIIFGGFPNGLDPDTCGRLIQLTMDPKRISFAFYDGEGNCFCHYPKFPKDLLLTLWRQLREAETSAVFSDTQALTSLIRYQILRCCGVPWIDANFQESLFRQSWEIIAWRMRQMKKHIENELLTQKFGISIQQINNRVRRVRGNTLHGELTLQRLRATMRISQLPQAQVWSNARIATECGFYDLSALNRSLQKHLGFRLREYRKALGKERNMLKIFNRQQQKQCQEIDINSFFSFEKNLMAQDATLITIYNCHKFVAEIFWLTDKGELTEIALLPAQSIEYIDTFVTHHLCIRLGDEYRYFRVDNQAQCISI